jgi:K(+)-stimulated pyrophosphate-energized sodium pump
MGMFQNNAGGAWDNAKKSFEKGVDIDGTMYYKHKADKPSRGRSPHQASML